MGLLPTPPFQIVIIARARQAAQELDDPLVTTGEAQEIFRTAAVAAAPKTPGRTFAVYSR
jgi:hypothetical protein